MKLLRGIVLAILSICFVNAYPTGDQYNGDFRFKYASSNRCVITGLDTNYKNAKSIIIPSYFSVNGKNCYIKAIEMGAFANAKFEKVTFNPSSVTVTIKYYAFYNCANLKKVIFNNGNVVIDYAAFSGSNKCDFDGSGVPKIINTAAKTQLKEWNLPVGYTGYDIAGTESRNKKMTDLYKLAKKMNENYNRFNWVNAGYNVLDVLVFRSGCVRGFHMAFRELAKAMGVDDVHFLTASDNVTTFWSYVLFRYDKWYDTWFNVDIYNYDYSKYTGNSYPSNFFMTDKPFANYLVNNVNTALPYENKGNPFKWVIADARYGTDHEGRQDVRILIDDYLKQNKLDGKRDLS